MTNENISGFLNSIAEAKRAFDAEPEYQSRIAELERDKQRMGETIASRELRIHTLKQDQETLTQRLRSAEVERDDAGFRALEEADKVQNLLTLMRGFINEGLRAVSAIDGVEQIAVSRPMIDAEAEKMNDLERSLFNTQAELAALRDDMRLAQEQLTRPFAITPVRDTLSFPVDTMDPFSPSPVHIVDEATGYAKPYEGKSAVDPTIAPTPSSNAPEEVTNASSVVSGSTEPPAGQSDSPFASNVTIGNTPEPVSVSSISAESGMSAVSIASQTPPERNRDESTRFKGRKYYDVTYFVPLHEWLSKGGTREDYDWRPLPEANRVYSS
jgi:hypothetical protein